MAVRFALRSPFTTLFGLVCVSAALNACGGSKPITDPASRYFSVHNAMQASGLSPVGPVSRGEIVAGQTAKIPLDLNTNCLTYVAFAAADSKDIELSLVNSEGKQVAKDDMRGPDATMRYCADRPGKYELQVKFADGGGSYMMSLWSGGGQAPVLSVDGGVAASGPQAGGGSCEAPTTIVAGQTYVGDTSEGRQMEEGSCGNTGARELVYRLDLPTRQRVTIDVRAQYDSVLYIRRGECSDSAAEVACNDDAPGGAKRSRIDEVLDPGTYFVMVDGYGEEEGSFRMSVAVHSAGTAENACISAPYLASGTSARGDMSALADTSHASCGRGAQGPDQAYRIEVPTRSRVRFIERTRGFPGVVHVHKGCERGAAEVGCSERAVLPNEIAYAGILEAGTYYAFADAAAELEAGDFNFSAELVSELGGNATADTCGDAQVLGDVTGDLIGDTFQARDDVLTSCGAEGAADVVYRLDVGKRSRIVANIPHDEGRHVLSLSSSCSGKSAELMCGNRVDKVVAPGTYFLIADGAAANSFGRFRLNYRVEDMTMADQACSSAPSLAVGQSASGTTKGGQNKFTSSCGGSPEDQDSADKVYKFTLARKSVVRATVNATDFAPLLAIRSSCGDQTSERGCAYGGGGGGSPTVLRRELAPGTYYLFVDGRGEHTEGDYSLSLNVEDPTTAKPSDDDEEGVRMQNPIPVARPKGPMVKGKAPPGVRPSVSKSPAKPPARPTKR